MLNKLNLIEKYTHSLASKTFKNKLSKLELWIFPHFKHQAASNEMEDSSSQSLFPAWMPGSLSTAYNQVIMERP